MPKDRFKASPGIRRLARSAPFTGALLVLCASAHASFFGLFGSSPPARPVVPAPAASRPAAVAEWCGKVQASVRSFHWKLDPCKGIDWKVGGHSAGGLPIVYAEFGEPGARNVTLVFTMVHGDEITPLYIGLELAHWLKDHEKKLQGIRVVLAPLVNPDGFFRHPRWRMNGHGVDVNRNFATSDWNAHALRAWKTRYHSDPRRNPGPFAGSEPETVFQAEMIRQVKPVKIISVHSPLDFLDYDGPSTLSLDRFPREYVKECLNLRSRVRAISSGFFPGSLGNYAGHQLGIPTLTLELPTANPRKARAYWKKFSEGLRIAIEFRMDSPAKAHDSAGM